MVTETFKLRETPRMTAAYLQPYMVLLTGWVLPMIAITVLFLWIEKGEPGSNLPE